MFDHQVNNKGKPEGSQRVTSGSTASGKKPSFMTSFDDLSLIFGGKLFKFIDFYYGEVISCQHIIYLFIFVVKASPSSEFEEVEGETEERRKARLGRHQRTQERAVCIIILSVFLISINKERGLINANCMHIFISS